MCVFFEGGTSVSDQLWLSRDSKDIAPKDTKSNSNNSNNNNNYDEWRWMVADGTISNVDYRDNKGKWYQGQVMRKRGDPVEAVYLNIIGIGHHSGEWCDISSSNLAQRVSMLYVNLLNV